MHWRRWRIGSDPANGDMLRPMWKLALLALVVGCDGSLGPPPPPPAHTERLMTGAVTLVGEGSATCSHSTNAVWCAFSVPGETSGLADLWVLNVSQAMASPGSAPCDGSNRYCLRLTSRLWTGSPLVSPGHPGIHGFEGETLFFYADSSSVKRDDPYLGAVKAWRPGWAGGRAISTTMGYICRGHAQPVAFCVDSVVQLRGNVEFDLLAGALNSSGPPLAKVAHLQALGSKGQIMWSAGFSPDGKHLALSSSTGNQDVEVLRAIPTAATGAMEPAELVRDAARWQIARDGKKVFYLKGYNYAERDIGPRGTLMMADFPTGANPTELQQGVGEFLPIGEGTGADQGLSFLRDFQNGRAVLQLQPDRTRPDRSLTLESFVDRYFVSPDRRYSYIAKLEPLMPPLGVIAKTNGGGACALSSRPGSTPYLVTFLPAAPVVLWAEDAPTGFDIEGWLANPDTCESKVKFTPHLADIVGVRDGVVFAEDDGDFRSMTIRHARLQNGDLPPDRGTLIRPGAGLKMVVTDDHYVLYTVSAAVDPDAEGLYAYGPLP
jgi:hypothetical protein